MSDLEQINATLNATKTNYALFHKNFPKDKISLTLFPIKGGRGICHSPLWFFENISKTKILLLLVFCDFTFIYILQLFLKFYPKILADSADINGLSLTIGYPKNSAFFFKHYHSHNALSLVRVILIPQNCARNSRVRKKTFFIDFWNVRWSVNTGL